MVFITKKKIRGKEYIYLEKSLRLSDSRIKRISKLIKKKKKLSALKAQYNDYFIQKEKEIFAEWALSRYRFKHPLNKEEVKKIEEIKVDYKRIMSALKKTPRLRDIFDRFTVNFTYESNAIEGNSLTLKDVAIVIFEGLSIPGKELREIYETRNSRPVVDLLLTKKIKMSHKSIMNIHKLLMRDIDKEIGYKKFPNFILGSTLKTSPPEKVYQDMNDLIRWYNLNKDKIYPLELGALFHGKFLQIHPFKDGNGRVARFLLNAQLINKGYPPLIIRKSHRVAYLRTLRAFDQGQSIPLVRFILEKFKKTYKNFFQIYVKYI